MADLADRLGVPPRLVGAVLFGTLLNPLNSSMIAVALVDLQRYFDVGVARSTWLVSGFYLVAAIGQPLLGRLVDLLGARQLFIGGLFLVLVVSLAAPFVPGFWWLVGIRAVQALGTSAAYPAALVVFRTAGGGAPPAGALAVLGVTAASSAALGPVIAGVLIVTWGWQAVFLVNVPLTIAGSIVASVVLPRSDARTRARPGEVLAALDLLGILLFSATVTALLMFLLSIGGRPRWWLLPVAVVALVLLVRRERAVSAPFLDVRGLMANRAMRSLLVQQGGINLVFYTVFFGLPLWLEAVRGLRTDQVGALMLPFTLMGLIVTPFAARVIRRRGVRMPLVVGSVLVVIGTLLIQLLDDLTPVVVIAGLAVIMGVPNGLNNLGLQTGLFAASPPERTGASGGLFQTFRYLGAISASAVLGVLLEQDLSSTGFHRVGLVASGTAVALVVLAWMLPRGLGSTPGRSP